MYSRKRGWLVGDGQIISGWRKSEGKGLGNRVGLARATVGMLGRLEWNVLSGRLTHQRV